MDARRWARGLLRSPLLHFMVAGALLLGVDVARARPHGDDGNRRIVVTRAIADELRSEWARRKGRGPTDDEMSAEIDRYVEEEALFRGAVGLGLHETDTIVRRRLVQRMRFLHEDMAAVREPSDEELSAYIAAHASSYAPEPRVTFDQVFFSRSARGSSLATHAGDALEGLRAGGEAKSDPYPLPLGTAGQTRGELARVLGPRLADSLFELPVGEWRGPFESSYGLHLVRVRERGAGAERDRETARSRAREDFRAEQRRGVEQALATALRQRFEVVRDDLVAR